MNGFVWQRKEGINPSDFNDASAQMVSALGRPDRLKIGDTDSRKGRENGFRALLDKRWYCRSQAEKRKGECPE
jgi:hypothetical protein